MRCDEMLSLHKLGGAPYIIKRHSVVSLMTLLRFLS